MKKILYLLIFVFVSPYFVDCVYADDLILSGPLSGTYISDDNIYTQGTCTVEPGTSAILEAGLSIILNPGFYAKPGCHFIAKPGQGVDNDSDGFPDVWEIEHFGHLDWGPDDDPDYDGLENMDEYMNYTDPADPDSEGDGMSDGWEILNGLLPLDNDAAGDADVDDYSNYVEYIGETDPNDDSKTPNSGYYNKYDKLGRLNKTVSVSGTQIEYEIEYKYDRVGNRTTKIVR